MAWRGPRTVLLFMIGVVLLGACDGTDDEGPTTRSSADCPELPSASGSMIPIWPADDASDLVPEFQDLCAAPADPGLFGLLNESASWSGDVVAGALGVLHLEGDEHATFSVTRVRPETPGLEQADEQMGGATTEVGEVTVSWVSSGSHVATIWLDELDIVTIAGADEEAVTEASSSWLSSAGHEGELQAPSNIPEVQEMPAALDARAPLDNVPGEYVALEYNPLMFMASDFADAVTIHEEEGIEAMGAAIILTEDHHVVGTAIAATGTTSELSEWPSQFEGSSDGAAAAGFSAGGVDAFVVGQDEDLVSDFVAAWENEASS